LVNWSIRISISDPGLDRQADLAGGAAVVVVGDAGGADYASVGGGDLGGVSGHAPYCIPGLSEADHVDVIGFTVERAVLGMQK